MSKLLLLIMFITGVAHAIPANIAPPTITDTDVQVKVSLNANTGVYEYLYTLTSAASNVGSIFLFGLDVGTDTPHASAFDPDLSSDQSREDGEILSYGPFPIPKQSVPVGIQSPYEWETGVGLTAEVGWGANGENFEIAPGQQLSGFVLRAKAPPGPRTFTLDPFFDDTGFPNDAEARPEFPMPWDFTVTGTTIGPVLASELKLYDDKGLPAAPDAFLAYSNPTQAPTLLPAGAKTFDLAVFYGKTIKPETFTATLLNSATVTATANGTVLTSQFHPAPDGFDVLHLNLAKGENMLILSVDGTRPNGTLPNGTLGLKEDVDVDKLVFTVP